MSMNSVNTNLGAMIALQSLNRTSSDMAVTQKAISTGLRVADAKDDGAAYAIAERVRSDIAGLTSVNQQLGGTKGLVDTTLKGLEKVSDTMKEMKKIVISLSNESVANSDRENYVKQYEEKLASVRSFVKDANYNGRSLIADGAAAPDTVGFGNISVVRNEKGSNYTVNGVDLEADLDKLDFGAGNYTAANMQAVLGGTSAGAAYDGVFKDVEEVIGGVQNTFGTASKYIDAQISYNSDRLDALKGGLGALVDADLSKEAANLQALQVRQQLGSQSLSISNQAPQSLLSLFR